MMIPGLDTAARAQATGEVALKIAVRHPLRDAAECRRSKQLARRIFTAFFTERVDIRDEAEILHLAGEVGFHAQWIQDAIKGAQARALRVMPCSKAS